VFFLLGRAVTHYFNKKKKGEKPPLIIIGKDTRLSCYMLEQAFASGVCSQGGKAILTGPLPTPGVAFAIKSMRAEAGVMISASHNSFEDNGIKIFDRWGDKLPDEIEEELEKMILGKQEIPIMHGENLGRAKRLDEIVGRYIVYVKSTFNPIYDLEGIRIVVDAANGAAYKIAPMIFEELGAEVITIGNSPNGRNINFETGATSPQQCMEAVKKYRADLGICLDGDADRLTLIDSRGEVVHGDRLLGLLARFQKEIGALEDGDEVVGTIMSNLGLEEYIKSLGLKFFRANVGDRYILNRMKDEGSYFGGEPSGHIIFKKYSTTGDGILAALKVIECLKHFKNNLHDLADEIQMYPQVLINTKVKNKRPFNDVPQIKDSLNNFNKELGDEGRIMLRYSGTESLARVMVEGKDYQKVKDICEELSKTVAKELSL
ncbi:phosphoglucosamine mutase, partial [Bacteriovoracaceae bacterium]|nr:phosphoglucosamine mutase [Bacteriovoracaceae bacterium]